MLGRERGEGAAVGRARTRGRRWRGACWRTWQRGGGGGDVALSVCGIPVFDVVNCAWLGDLLISVRVLAALDGADFSIRTMQGKWSPPRIDNPEYIGEWKARQVTKRRKRPSRLVN
eukprot:6196539-Pleurochrysis_carterae.AAC.3